MTRPGFRYLPMLLAFAIFLGSLGYSLTATRNGHQTLGQISNERIFWSAAQAEIESLRFINILERFSRGDLEVSADDVIERYEIFWSRIHLFRSGQVGLRLSSFPEVTGKVEQLVAVLRDQERAVMQLSSLKRTSAREIAIAFQPCTLVLREISIAVAADEERRFASLRNALRDQDWQVLAFTLGLLTTGGLLVFLLDRERRANVKLAHRNADLAREATQSNRAKSNFLAMMSHELRTPMNGVLGMINLLLGSSLDLTQRDYAERANRAGTALLKIINDTLELSQMELGRADLAVEDFRLRDVTRCVTDLFASAGSGRDVTVIMSVADDIPTRLVGDSKRLQQILINLVGTALKVTLKGEVKIILRRLAGPDLRLRFEIANPDAEFDKNQILEDNIELLANEDHQRQNLGLGLSLSKKLVALMEGVIGVEGSPGEGITFWFELPFGLPGDPSCGENPRPYENGKSGGRKAETGEDPRVAREMGDINKRGRGRVLIVEELATDREILRAYLEKSDFEVSFADTIAEGISAPDRPNFDAVLVNLPRRTIHRLITRDQENTPPLGGAGIPIIGMLDAGDEELLKSCRSSGLSACLAKPLNPQVLTHTLSNCLAAVPIKD